MRWRVFLLRVKPGAIWPPEDVRKAGKLTEQDWWIANQVGPTLREKGLIFVGLDVIGDKLTEINVTSPTCAQELDQQFGLNIAGLLMDHIEHILQ